MSSDATTRTISFLGSLIKMPLTSEETDGQLAVIEHSGARGYSAPMHRHQFDDETFIVLEGKIHVVSDGEIYKAEAGATLFLPKKTLHGFVVENGPAHFLTVHTPGGFDAFTADVGTLVDPETLTGDFSPQLLPQPSREELTAIAAKYGIEIMGPPPVMPEN